MICVQSDSLGQEDAIVFVRGQPLPLSRVLGDDDLQDSALPASQEVNSVGPCGTFWYFPFLLGLRGSDSGIYFQRVLRTILVKTQDDPLIFRGF